jgi:short-subunit dehydrogenase
MASEQSRFKGKAALITGAGSGIGRALALALAAQGANLILAARSLDSLSEVADAAPKQGESEILVQPTDVGDPEAVERLAQATARAFGGLDILINCAGIGYGGNVIDSDPEQAQEMIRVNLFGLYLVTRHCLPLIIQRGGGDVVNFASIAGLLPSPGYAVYAATKYGVRGFSESLRQEVREQGVRVMTVHPGMTQTAFFDRFGESPVPPGVGQELMSPEHVASAIVEALALPPETMIGELTIRPTWQVR